MMNPLTVEDLLRSIRGLTATKFVSNGFSNSPLNLIIAAGDGKQTQNVQIAKNGNGYVGKVGDSPLLYEIEAKSINDLLKSADSLQPAMPPAKQ